MARFGKKILAMLKFQIAFVVPSVILIVQLWHWQTHLLGYLGAALVALTVGLAAAKFKGWIFPLNLGECFSLVLPTFIWLIIAMRVLILTLLHEPHDEMMIVINTEVCTRSRCGGCIHRIYLSRSLEESGNTICPDRELAKALSVGDTVLVNGVFTPYASYYRRVQIPK